MTEIEVHVECPKCKHEFETMVEVDLSDFAPERDEP